MSIIRNIWNTIVNFINFILKYADKLLPPSPFAKYINALSDNELLGYVNYLIPIDTFIVIGEAWLLAIAVYILYGVIIKWAKVVET